MRRTFLPRLDMRYYTHEYHGYLHIHFTACNHRLFSRPDMHHLVSVARALRSVLGPKLSFSEQYPLASNRLVRSDLDRQDYK